MRICCCCCSVAVTSDSLRARGPQHTSRLPCVPLSPGVCLDSCPLKSVMPTSHLILCCPLLLPSVFPSIRSFLVSQLFASGGHSVGASASASVLPVNIHCWFPLGLTVLISLQCKGLSRVFSSTRPILLSISRPQILILCRPLHLLSVECELLTWDQFS